MDDFWQHPPLIAALQQRHMGHVIRAYRQHPHHTRRLSQEAVAEWARMTQPQLSRLETGPPIVHLDRLIHWARLLNLPASHLWFTLPLDGEEDDVRRNDFLRLGAAVVTAPSISWGRDPVEEFAWRLWSDGRSSLHPSELDSRFATSLQVSSFVTLESDGSYALAHPSLLDFFVARRIFNEVSHGRKQLFASAQTSHDTDHVLRRFVAHDKSHTETLVQWMTNAQDAVLRVNSAGVLGKLDAPGVVVNQLRVDSEVRDRYVTAVASRVLDMPWNDAARIAQGQSLPDQCTARIADELLSSRDGAARWCTLIVLHNAESRHDQLVTRTLHRALHTETEPETLRAIGGLLAGISPLDV